MPPIISILFIFLALSTGAFSILLLSRLRKRYTHDYLNSFYYYQLISFIFGVYGILGSIAIKNILLKFELSKPLFESVSHFFPFLGIPFIVAAWYMLLKLSAEIANKTLRQSIAIAYFSIMSVGFLFYGWLIKRIPELSNPDFDQLKLIIHSIFYTSELIITLYIVLFLFIQSKKKSFSQDKTFIKTFSLILISVSILRSIALHFYQIHDLIGLYYLVMFFGGNLPLIVLCKNHLEKNKSNESIKNPFEDLVQTYGITKREKEIILKICKGLSNKEISEELFISLQTVKDHTHNIYRKT